MTPVGIENCNVQLSGVVKPRLVARINFSKTGMLREPDKTWVALPSSVTMLLNWSSVNTTHHRGALEFIELS